MVSREGIQRHSLEVDLTEEMHICSKAQHSCEQTLAYCLKQGGEHAKPERIETLID